MMMDGTSWVLVVALAIFVVASCGLLSSMSNRRRIATVLRTVEHTDRNAKMATQLLARREARMEAAEIAAAVKPVDVTIVNHLTDPAPTKGTNEGS